MIGEFCLGPSAGCAPIHIVLAVPSPVSFVPVTILAYTFVQLLPLLYNIFLFFISLFFLLLHVVCLSPLSLPLLMFTPAHFYHPKNLL